METRTDVSNKVSCPNGCQGRIIEVDYSEEEKYAGRHMYTYCEKYAIII